MRPVLFLELVHIFFKQVNFQIVKLQVDSCCNELLQAEDNLSMQ